jgi:DNA-directed RNA polymerase specialized sigma24 family protein
MAKYNRFSDTELIDLLRKEDNRAFIEIFDRYYILLFSFACRRLDDKEIAKDLIHDAFADIWSGKSVKRLIFRESWEPSYSQ